MSTSTLILNPGSSGDAQVSPDRFPAAIILSYEPQGEASVQYGLDGKNPSIELKPGQTKVTINANSLQLRYEVVTGQAKIQWEL